MAYTVGDVLIISNLDGTGRKVLTILRDQQSGLFWAPRGERLAILTGDAYENQDLTIHILHLPDGEIEASIQLISPGWDEDLSVEEAQRSEALDALGYGSIAWSPDGRYLAFAGIIEGPSSDLYIYNTQTRKVKRLTSGLNQAYGLTWSPDGKWIVHMEVISFTGWWVETVWAAASDGSMNKRVYSPEGRPNYIGWSGDDTLAVFDHNMAPGSHNLRKFNLSNDSVTLLYKDPFDDVATDTQGYVYALAIGKHLADEVDLENGVYLLNQSWDQLHLVHLGNWNFVEWSDELDVFIAQGNDGKLFFTIDGEIRTDINLHESTSPSPDGNWLALYGGESRPQPGVRLMAADGQWVHRVTDLPTSFLIWQPDSSAYYFVAEDTLYRVLIPDGEPIRIAEYVYPWSLTLVAPTEAPARATPTPHPPTPTHTPVISTQWFGMEVPIKVWKAETIEGDPYRHGLLTHRAITNCRVVVMSEEPRYVGVILDSWEIEYGERQYMDPVAFHRVLVKDEDGMLRLIYYDLGETTCLYGPGYNRLAYLLVDTPGQLEQCAQELETIFTTLQPMLFPDLDITQG